MKKINIISLMTLAVLAIACSKNEPIDPDQEVPSVDVENTPSDYLCLTFGTKTEELPSSKTTYTDGALAWEKGDKIKVLFGEESNETEAESSGTNTNFTVSVPGETTAIYFAYPSSEGVTLADDALTLTIPSETDGSFVSANYMIAKALPADETVTFYHAGVIFKVIIEDPTITKAVITGNNGEALAGTLAYTFTEDGISYGEASETSTSLTMNFTGAGTYYASALPGLELAAGATIRLYRGEEQAGGNMVATAIPVERAKVASFGKDVEMINRYVSASATGEGNGRTEAAAWSMAQFENFMEGRAYDAQKYTALDGITVHLMAGTHTAVSEIILGITNKVKIIGTDGTVIKPSAPGYRFITCKEDGADLSFENITFDGFSASGDGGILAANDGTITFKGCTFSNNMAVEGGVTNSWSEAIINLVNCDFYENSTTDTVGKCGGVVKINGGTLNVTECNFTDNHCTGGSAIGGGAVYLRNGNSSFTDCIFDGNNTNTTTGAYNAEMGGAVSIINGTHKFHNCLFTGNSATQAGAVCIGNNTNSTPAAYFNNCVFTGNYISYRYGTTIYSYGGSTLCMNNCSFADDTYSINGSNNQCAWLNLKGTLIMSNCSLIGTMRKGTEMTESSTSDDACLVRFDGNAGTHGFSNNLIVSTNATYKTAVWTNNSSIVLMSWGTKFSGIKHNAGSATEKFYNATYKEMKADYLDNLVWTVPSSGEDYAWNNCYWSWTGRATDWTSSTGFLKCSDIPNKINEAAGDKNNDCAFTTWLRSIDALDKDCRGKLRGESTWPGAYDGTNN